MLPASVLLTCTCHPATQAADELWCSGVCQSSSPRTDKCISCTRAALVAMHDEQVSTCGGCITTLGAGGRLSLAAQVGVQHCR